MTTTMTATPPVFMDCTVCGEKFALCLEHYTAYLSPDERCNEHVYHPKPGEIEGMAHASCVPTQRFDRKSKIVDGLVYLETDRSLRRRINALPGPIEYRDKPE